MSDKNNFPIAVLISGRGSNMTAVHEAMQRGECAGQIACVISSSVDAGGLDYARAQGIPATALPAESLRKESAMTHFLMEKFRQHEVRLVVLAGFLRKIPAEVVDAFPNAMINIHPALLPAFGGKGMYGKRVHAAVLEYGCKVSGATVHIVSSEYDTGAPVLQDSVPVLQDDTPEALAARILKVEHKLLPKAVNLFASGRIKFSGRQVVISPPGDG